MASSLARPIPDLVETDFLRFWKKATPVDQRHPSRCCWEWTGKLNTQGYALFSMGRAQFRASRVAWFMITGTQPPREMDMRHQCDNPRCVRPSHLLPGTRSENVADMIRRSRHRNRGMPGETNPKASLCKKDVQNIRRLWAKGHSRVAIERSLTVGRGAIAGVIDRTTWTHLPYEEGIYEMTLRRVPLPRIGMRGVDHPQAVLTPRKVRVIRQALAKGKSQASLARKYGVTSGAISNIARGKSWSHLT